MQQKLMQPQSRRLVIALVFSILWTVIQYSSGNGWEGIYLVLFVLATLLFRPVVPMLLVFFIAIVLLFISPNVDTLFQLKSAYRKAAKSPGLTVNEIVRPGSGKQVLAKQVLQMLALIEKHDLQEYSLSKQIRQNNMFIQRITESAWPIRQVANSPYQLRLNTEKPISEQCQLFGQQEDISLDYCR